MDGERFRDVGGEFESGGFAGGDGGGEWGEVGGFAACGAVAGAGEREDFLGEGGEFGSFGFEWSEVVGGLRAQFHFEDAEGRAEAGERGAEFVGGVAEEAFLAGDQLVEASGHGLDRVAEVGEFVVATRGEGHVEISGGDVVGGVGEVFEVAGDAKEEGRPEREAEDEDGEAAPEPGFQVEEHAGTVEAVGAQQEHVVARRAGARGGEDQVDASPVAVAAVAADEEGGAWGLWAGVRWGGCGGGRGIAVGPGGALAGTESATDAASWAGSGALAATVGWAKALGWARGGVGVAASGPRRGTAAFASGGVLGAGEDGMRAGEDVGGDGCGEGGWGQRVEDGGGDAAGGGEGSDGVVPRRRGGGFHRVGDRFAEKAEAFAGCAAEERVEAESELPADEAGEGQGEDEQVEEQPAEGFDPQRRVDAGPHGVGGLGGGGSSSM